MKKYFKLMSIISWIGYAAGIIIFIIYFVKIGSTLNAIGLALNIFYLVLIIVCGPLVPCFLWTYSDLIKEKE